ncbi:MAG: AAA family ATPase, partial [Acetobacteraceae bacterium]|nr:AAA family ATPase [Acetobacteraceae bacterium]
MKLRSLELENFRKFERRVRIPHFADGLNVLCGPNEFGKSTLLAAIRGVLFERHGSRAESVRRMQHLRNQTSPVVALSFEHEGGLYQIEKRFLHREPYARLIRPDGARLDGDGAEEALQALLGFRPAGNKGARPEDAGMWGALWVTQRQSCDQPDLPDPARSMLQTCLEAEIGVLTGGARGQALLRDVQAELARLLDGRDKPRGRLKELGELLAATEAEIAGLASKRQGLEDDLNALQRCVRELALVNNADEAARLEADLADARRRREAVLRYEDRRTQAVTALRLTEEKNADASGETARRAERAKALDAARRLLTQAEAERVDARDALARTEAALSERQAVLDAAQRQADSASPRLRVARQVASLATRSAEMATLAERLGRAEAAQAAVNALAGELAAMRIDAARVKAVHEAGRELIRAQAVLDALATVIELDIEREGAGRIEINGTAAETGRTTLRAVTDVAIAIPGIGRIAIRPAIRDRETLKTAITDAERKLARALAEAGATDAADAERRLAARSECERQLKLVRAELAAHAPGDRAQNLASGADALRNHVAIRQRRLEAEMAELGLSALPSPQEAAAAEQEAARAEALAAEALAPARAALAVPAAERSYLADALARAAAHSQATEAEVERLLRETERATARESDEALAARLLAATDAVERQRAVVGALEAERPQDTLDVIDARIRRFEQAIGQRRETQQRLQRDKA